MTTQSSTFHVQLFPTDSQHQQKRSTRKTARGATPLFLNLNSKVDRPGAQPTLASPRTKATRRRGQVFKSPSNTLSSTDSIDSDYVFINAQIRSDLELHSPPFCTSPPLAIKPVNPDNQSYPGSGTLVKAKTGDRNSSRDTEGPQRLAQPFLLQLRSLPGPATTNINSAVRHPKLPSHVSSPSNMDFSTSPPISPTTPRHVLTESQKRRKLAKLARTLGENVPPELVFQTSPPLQRNTTIATSTPASRPRPHKPSLPAKSSTFPPLFIAVPAADPAPQPQSTTEPGTTVKQRRTSRPQSMIFPSSPTMASPSVRRVSLDRIPENEDAPFQELAIFVTSTESTVQSDAPSHECEWGRRKEREWSGEWNVKDMRRVAKALRGLKAS